MDSLSFAVVIVSRFEADERIDETNDYDHCRYDAILYVNFGVTADVIEHREVNLS